MTTCMGIDPFPVGFRDGRWAVPSKLGPTPTSSTSSPDAGAFGAD